MESSHDMEQDENIEEMQHMFIKVECDTEIREINEFLDLPSLGSFTDATEKKFSLLDCPPNHEDETSVGRKPLNTAKNKKLKGQKQSKKQKQMVKQRQANFGNRKVGKTVKLVESGRRENDIGSPNSSKPDAGKEADALSREENLVTGKVVKSELKQTVVKAPCKEDRHIDLHSDDEVASKCLSKRAQKEKKLVNYFCMKCHVCQQKFNSWTPLAAHYAKEHDVRAKMTCVCGSVATGRDSMRKHIKIHENGTKYRCIECQRSFYNRSDLETHTLSHLPKDLWPFQCGKCSKRFFNKQVFQRHQNTHLPVEERYTWTCDICGKCFGTKTNLVVHKKHIHLGEKQFVCEFCGRTFTQKGLLQQHMPTHSDDRPFVCSHCSKRFKTKYQLKVHEDIHGDRAYQCPECKLQLSSRVTLRKHLVVHKDDRPFQCQICEKSFRRSKELKSHVEIHSGNRPYLCAFCSRDFATRSNCNAHHRKMHPEEWKGLKSAQAAASLAKIKGVSDPGTTSFDEANRSDIKQDFNTQISFSENVVS